MHFLDTRNDLVNEEGKENRFLIFVQFLTQGTFLGNGTVVIIATIFCVAFTKFYVTTEKQIMFMWHHSIHLVGGANRETTAMWGEQIIFHLYITCCLTTVKALSDLWSVDTTIFIAQEINYNSYPVHKISFFLLKTNYCIKPVMQNLN